MNDLREAILKEIAGLMGAKPKEVHPDSATAQTVNDIMALIATHTAKEVEGLKQSYELKIQDLAIETYIHSKIFEWAESRMKTKGNQNGYLGPEGAGYNSAQEEISELLVKWREEALQVDKASPLDSEQNLSEEDNVS